MNMTTVCIALAAVLTVGGAAGGAALQAPPRPVDFDPAPLPTVTLAAGHPRIWFTAAEVPGLRQQCLAGGAKGALDQVRRQAANDKQSATGRAFDLAFLYQMTGDAAHAKQAIALIRGNKAFDWVGLFNSGHPYGGANVGMADPLACVFDWCHDQMTDDDRRAIGGVLREELAHGPYRTRFHEPWWMTIWLSEILALHGAGIDDPLAATHLAAYNRSIHQFAVLADVIHADGAMGDYQYQYMHFMYWPEMWLRATGENLFQTCGFYRNQPEYNYYSILPDGHWLPSDGDGSFDSLGAREWSDNPSRAYFHFYGWRSNNPAARWIDRQMKPWRTVGVLQPWQQIVWAGEGGEETPLAALPTVKHFASNHVAILRSGWDLRPESTDTVAAFYCRPREGHTHRNAGHFALWRGLDNLLRDSGSYVTTGCPHYDNFYTRTVAHNCVLIYDPAEPLQPGYPFMTARDGGQVLGDASHYPVAEKLMNGYGYRGEIGNFTDDTRYTYLYADISPAYRAPKAVHVARAFFWLKPATFVVCDWVTSVKPEAPKRWVLNLPARPSLDGAEKVVAGTAEAGIVESAGARLATLTRGKSNLFVRTLAPERTLLRKIGGKGYSAWVEGKNWDPPPVAELPGTEAKRQRILDAELLWRLEVEAAEPAAATVFLHVLDATAADVTAAPPATLVKRGEAVGAALQRGGASTEILFYPDGRASVDGKIIGVAVPPLPASAK